MIPRAFLAWLAILVLAVLNGAFRQGILVPWIGESAGHVVSTVSLSALVVIAAWFLVPWIGPAAPRDAWVVGMLWLGLTLAFEFLAGHYLFRISWERLCADYDLPQGRIWILVPVTTLIAVPLITSIRRRPTGGARSVERARRTR